MLRKPKTNTMIEKCPTPRSDCPYFGNRTRGPLKREQSHGCFSDTDHIIPQRLAKRTGDIVLAREIIQSPDNLQQLCRWEHDAKTENENERMLLRALTQRMDERRLLGDPDAA